MNRAQINQLIHEVFRRISSGGLISVAELFTPDGIYEGAYVDDYMAGRASIDAMIATVIPAAIHPFRQWPIGIYFADDDDIVTVEYMSEGTGVHDGSLYRNRYAGIIRIENGLIAHWREYYDPRRFDAAVGPGFEAIVRREMPPGAMLLKPAHTAIRPLNL